MRAGHFPGKSLEELSVYFVAKKKCNISIYVYSSWTWTMAVYPATGCFLDYSPDKNLVEHLSVASESKWTELTTGLYVPVTG